VQQECSSCATASTCLGKEGQRACRQKADIDVKHVIMVLSGKAGSGNQRFPSICLCPVIHGRSRAPDLDMHGPTSPRCWNRDHKLQVMASG